MANNDQDERQAEDARDEPRAINDSRKRTPVPAREVNTVEDSKPGFRQRWAAAQPNKVVLFWACVATAVLTMVIGFNWGGWVTADTAQDMAQDMADDAIVQRLAPICFAQFAQDPDRELKRSEMIEQANSQRVRYVQEQGWATISGEEQPDRNVARACSDLILEMSP